MPLRFVYIIAPSSCDFKTCICVFLQQAQNDTIEVNISLSHYMYAFKMNVCSSVNLLYHVK